MPKEVLENVFEPLFSTKGFGVGLGLPIAKNVMEGHGGGVEIESQVGQGTTVVMWLPREEAAGST
jgi:signal transduction histidine kinase